MWVSGEAQGSQEETILHPGARWLLRAWAGLRGERSAPARTDLELGQMPRIAPWMFIAVPEPSGFPLRLAGTGLCGFVGRELTGSDLLEGWERFERSVMDKALRAVAARHQTAHFRLRFRTDKGQMIGADMLALPVIARDGVTTHVLGGLFPHADPQLWHYTTLTPAELAAARMLDGGGAPEEPLAAGPQARRKFRVISGGLEQA